MEQLEFIINGAGTKRYHTWPMLNEQTVGAHTFTVAMLYSMMALQDGELGTGGLTVPGLMAVLTHDLPEHKMADFPSPHKRSFGEALSITKNGEVISFRDAWNEAEQELLDGVGLSWWQMLTSQQKRWLELADNMEGALHCIRERQMGNQLIVTVFANYRSYLYDLSGDDEGSCEAGILNYIDDMWEQAHGQR